MEHIFLVTAVVLTAGAAALSFIKPGFRTLIIALWSASSTFILVDIALMACYLAGGRFDFSYVYAHTEKALPLAYRISALWSGQEGSFLLWSAALAVTGFFTLPGKDAKSRRVFGVYASISFFVFLMCIISQPFAMQPAQPDGLGMAEALQDPWMVVHPPLVFIAYSAMAALAARCADMTAEADRSVKVWARISYTFLGLGIFTGSIWAYRALGWGGYWSWDPIENAALVPWLLLCGALHSGTPGRIMRALPFGAAALGTFLARSGVLSDRSNHAYAEGNSVISALVLVLLAGAACLLLILRLKRKTPRIRRLSAAEKLKDTKRLFRYVVFAYSALIAFGTLAPLVFGFNMPEMYYNAASIAFVLCYSMLLIAQDIKALRTKIIAAMALGAALAIGAAVAADCPEAGWMLLLWVCVLPLCSWAVCGFRSHGVLYYLRHAGIVLLAVGAVISCGMGGESVALVGPESSTVSIAGTEVKTEDILGSDTLIISSVAGDAIVKRSDIAGGGGVTVIPYTKKPMITLFWAGGFAAVLLPCAALIKRQRRHSHATNDAPSRDFTA